MVNPIYISPGLSARTFLNYCRKELDILGRTGGQEAHFSSLTYERLYPSLFFQQEDI